MATNGFNGFSKDTVKFLKALEKNNDKAWFDAHRQDYEQHYLEPAKQLVTALGPGLKKISSSIEAQPKVNGSIFRINRDIRFSKDKTPYKPHIDLWFWEGDERSFGSSGFFLRLAPKQLILGAGLHRFDKEQLKGFRSGVDDEKRGKALVTAIKRVTDTGEYEVRGESYKKVPRGFDPQHPRAALLRHGSLHAVLEQKLPAEIHSPAFVEYCLRHFKAMAPIHKWLMGLSAS